MKEPPFLVLKKNKSEKISSNFQRKKGKFQNYLKDATIFWWALCYVICFTNRKLKEGAC
jgi:hypothetical protein